MDKSANIINETFTWRDHVLRTGDKIFYTTDNREKSKKEGNIIVHNYGGKRAFFIISDDSCLAGGHEGILKCYNKLFNTKYKYAYCINEDGYQGVIVHYEFKSIERYMIGF